MGAFLSQFPYSGPPCFYDTRFPTCPDHLEQKVSRRAYPSPPNTAGTWKERKGDDTLIIVAPGPGELTLNLAALDVVLEISERLARAALRRPARVRWLAKRKSHDKRYMNKM
jgi:hypothetical protein